MPTSVAVLGLGRMGTAIARRLAEQGWTVSGWSRSGGGRPQTVTQGADFVVLALFDGPACEQVLEQCRDGLFPGTTVVNTSTVAPQEAAALEKTVTATGAGYVHAPVMGSVPAAMSGRLRVLAGGSEADLTAARELLTTLGEVLPAGDAAAAAALKLVANGALGSAVMGIRDGRRNAMELGVGLGATLDVLERGPLGSIAQAKRPLLQPDPAKQPAKAEFTVAALAKDLALLAKGSPAAGELSRQVTFALTSGAVAGDADIAELTDPSAYQVNDEVLAPLHAYVRGHATGDPAHFREAFLPTAHIEGLRDGEFVSWSLADYCALFAGTPADDEPLRRRRIDQVSVEGSVGTATMTLHHGSTSFTDVFLLVRVDDGWRIANKAYHRADE